MTGRKLLHAAWPTLVAVVVYAVLLIISSGCASLERLADKGGTVTVGKGQKCPEQTVKVEVNVGKGAIVQTSTASLRK